MYKLSTIVNNLTRAHREGDRVAEAFWAAQYDELRYVW